MGLGLAVVRLLVKRWKDQVFVASVAACGAVLIVMALLPYRWLSFVIAVVFGMEGHFIGRGRGVVKRDGEAIRR